MSDRETTVGCKFSCLSHFCHKNTIFKLCRSHNFVVLTIVVPQLYLQVDICAGACLIVLMGSFSLTDVCLVEMFCTKARRQPLCTHCKL